MLAEHPFELLVAASAAGANPATAREAATARTAMRFMVKPPVVSSGQACRAARRSPVYRAANYHSLSDA